MLKNFIYCLCFALFIIACSNPSNIGEDLLSDEKLDLSYQNNFKISASTIPGDELFSYFYSKNEFNVENIFSPETAIIGAIQDPKFGNIESNFYAQFKYNSNFPTPKFTDVNLDSAVMVLAYDTIGFYGDKSSEHVLKIEEITEAWSQLDSISSNKQLSVGNLIAEKIFVPNTKDSLTIINHSDSTKQRISAQLRIRLSDSWAKALVANPLIIDGPSEEADKKLQSIFKGFKISSNSKGNGFLAFNTNSTSIGTNGITRLTFYFTQKSDKKKVSYSFYMDSKKFLNFNIDQSSAAVSEFINNPEKSDSLLFIQGLNGPNFYVELNDLSALKDRNINHAILEMTVAQLPDDRSSLRPITQLLASKKVGNSLVIIKDVADLISASNSQSFSLSDGFDGALKSVNGRLVYNLNITKHLKELLKNENQDRKIYISANNKSVRPNRSIIYGPKHSKYPIKLKVTYSE